MKRNSSHLHGRLSLSKRFQRVDRGFALIATITLMVLLALLSVGLLTMASSQMKISQKGLYAAEARSQARLALEVAIGKLQTELGPDQRISANSGIMSSSNSENMDGIGSGYILGVWNSWDTWLNRKNSTGLSIQSTYDTGRQQLFREWLISDNRLDTLAKIDAVSRDLGTVGGRDLNKVQLLGAGSLGLHPDKKLEIYAGLVQVDDSVTADNNKEIKKNARTKKNIAWWISAENQKARINIGDGATQSTDKLTILRNTWNTPGPDLESMDSLQSIASSLPERGSDQYDEKVEKIITRDTLGLLSTKSSDYKSAFHDFTLTSSGILADVKFGGLKKDMNILFSQDKLPDTFQSSSADAGLRPYTTDDGSPSVKNRPIASWNQLFQWANVWDSSTTLQGQDKSAKLQWDGSVPYTLVAADAESATGVMDNRYTYVRQPIMLKQYQFWGFQYEDSGFTSGGHNGGVINVKLAMIPVYVWWNPYNVPLKLEGADGAPWGSYFSQSRQMPIVMTDSVEFKDSKSNNEGSISAFYKYAGNTDHDGRALDDYATTFRESSSATGAGGTKGDVVTMKPGEVLIFTMPPQKKTLDAPRYYQVRLDKLSQADRVVDYLPFQKGTLSDSSDSQFSPYAITAYSAWALGKLVNNPQGRTDNLLTFTMDFADHYDTSKPYFYTPEDRLLAYHYSPVYKKKNKTLGSYLIGSGTIKTSMLGKAIGESESDPEVFSKTSPAVLNLNWGAWQESFGAAMQPSADYWSMPSGTSDSNMLYTGYTGKPRLEAPFFGAYFGVSAKWDTTPLVGTYPTNKDYRAKTWQHSSPIFWGGQMETASELGRTYSPYQFEVKQGSSDVEQITIANIISQSDSSNVPFAGPGSSNIVNRIVATELPLHQPYSIAGFAGARLSPGWYTDGSSYMTDACKRFAYQSGVPGVGLGNAFADPMLPADQVFSHNEIFGDSELGDFWDHALMANDGVWDSWFCSSISTRPKDISGGSKIALADVLEGVFPDTGSSSSSSSNSNSSTGLANTRLKTATGSTSVSEIRNKLAQSDGYKYSSNYLRLNGAFNVNSTSVESWKAILKGLKNRSILAMTEEGQITTLASESGKARFTRYGVASGTTSHVDTMGEIGITKGIQNGDFNSWSDLRELDDSSLESLAKEMVKQVKQRGPFLNMADFINRRLTSGDTGLKGALQAAIDNSGANDDFNRAGATISPSVKYPNQKAAEGSVYTAAPGYLIQSDVLAVLGNILTTRDDTFTIRAYGEVTTKSGQAILSRAWCEATVQRTINYVEPIDTPETPVKEVDLTTGTISDSDLSEINKAFGRKFEIVSFRWLSPDEV